MVVNAAGPHKWNVVFDYEAKLKTISSICLTIVKIDAGISFDKKDAADTDPNVSIGVCSFCHCHQHCN